MDNYKVKDEAESKEAQELFVQLGYELDSFFGTYSADTKWVLACTDGSMGCASDGMVKDTLKEIAFPQLRDLVVLKRNDVSDATHFDPEDGLKYIDLSGKWHWFNEEVNDEFPKLGWHESANTREYDDRGLKPITKPQDPALISGADIPSLIKKGESVQFRSAFNVQGGGEWKDLNIERDEEEFSLGDLINTRFEWRLKPTTLKVNAELPKPNKETQHNSLVYAVTYEFKTREARNAFADKLRGTNS